MTDLCDICGARPGVYMIGGSLLCKECADQEVEDLCADHELEDEDPDLQRVRDHLEEIERINTKMERKAVRSLTKFVEDLDLEDQGES